MTTPSPEFESTLERFPVKLEVFEGPLDLLLHLIKKHELDIYDIPIALITRQYLDYIGFMQDLQLDVAGDFLVMAATLIHIKSRSLLPRPAPEQEDPEEDPREALVRRLVEHQKFKAAAELLHDRETVRSAQWSRPDERIAALAGEGLDKEPELEVDLFSLMTAFKAIVERAKQRPVNYLPMEQMPLEMRIEQLMARLAGVEALGFRGVVRRRRPAGRSHRHVPGHSRDDSPQGAARIPERHRRAHSRVQAGSSRRRAPPDRAPRARRAAARHARIAVMSDDNTPDVTVEDDVNAAAAPEGPAPSRSRRGKGRSTTPGSRVDSGR